MSAPIIDYTNSAFARALGHRRGFIEQPDRALASLPPTLLRFRRKDIDETWRSLDITPHELIISEDKGRGRELRTARLVITPTRLRSALAIPPTRKTLVVSFGCGYRTRLWELNAGSLGERRFGLRLDTPEHCVIATSTRFWGHCAHTSRLANARPYTSNLSDCELTSTYARANPVF
jgi:hypothetical protein